MKSTGIVRRVDELGRIVIPMELRNKLKIIEKDPIEIYVDGTSIVLRKFEDTCIFCESTKDIVEYKGKLVCSKCLKNLLSLDNTINNKENIHNSESILQ